MRLLPPTFTLIHKEYQDGHINGYEAIGRLSVFASDITPEMETFVTEMITNLHGKKQPFESMDN